MVALSSSNPKSRGARIAAKIALSATTACRSGAPVSLPRLLRLHRVFARYPARGEAIPPDPNAQLPPVLREEVGSS